MAWDVFHMWLEEAVVLPPLYVEAAVSRRRWLKKHQDEEAGGERRRTKHKNQSEDKDGTNHGASSSSPEDTEGLCVVSEDMCVFLTWGGGQDATNSWSHTTANTPNTHRPQRFLLLCGVSGNVPATVTLAVALTVLTPALCLLEARQVYRAGLFTVTFRMDWITSPDNVSSTDAPEICEKHLWGGMTKTWGNFNLKWHQNIQFH